MRVTPLSLVLAAVQPGADCPSPPLTVSLQCHCDPSLHWTVSGLSQVWHGFLRQWTPPSS